MSFAFFHAYFCLRRSIQPLSDPFCFFFATVEEEEPTFLSWLGLGTAVEELSEFSFFSLRRCGSLFSSVGLALPSCPPFRGEEAAEVDLFSPRLLGAVPILSFSASLDSSLDEITALVLKSFRTARFLLSQPCFLTGDEELVSVPLPSSLGAPLSCLGLTIRSLLFSTSEESRRELGLAGGDQPAAGGGGGSGGRLGGRLAAVEAGLFRTTLSSLFSMAWKPCEKEHRMHVSRSPESETLRRRHTMQSCRGCSQLRGNGTPNEVFFSGGGVGAVRLTVLPESCTSGRLAGLLWHAGSLASLSRRDNARKGLFGWVTFK